MDFSEISFNEAIRQVIDAQQSDMLKDRIFGSFGLRLEYCDEEKREWADFIYVKKEQHLNPYNGVHGGVACAIADSCMGSTVCAATQELPSTTDISISYLAPMTVDEYRIHVEIKKVGKQLAACTCEITEKETGRLCVNVMGKFIIVRKDILADKDASFLLKDKK